MNSIDCALLLGKKQLILIKNSNSSRSLAVLTKLLHLCTIHIGGVVCKGVRGGPGRYYLLDRSHWLTPPAFAPRCLPRL